MPQQFTVNTTVCHLPTVYIKDHFLTISTHCKRRIICLKSGAFKYLSTNTHMCILRHFNRQRRWSFYFFINCSSSFFYRSFIGLLIAVIALEWHENVAFPIPRMENRIMPSIDILFRNKMKFGAYIYFNTCKAQFRQLYPIYFVNFIAMAPEKKNRTFLYWQVDHVVFNFQLDLFTRTY